MAVRMIDQPSPSKARSPRFSWKNWSRLLYVSPWLIGFLIFKAVPILLSLWYSFTDFYLLRPQDTQFIGLKNYIRLLHDMQAGYSLFTTIGFAFIAIPTQLFVSLFLAALLSSPRLKGKLLLRTLFFMPAIIPGVAIFSIWTGFINPGTGWLNQLILLPLGLPPFSGVNGESGYNFLLILMTLWSIGPSFIIMLGSINSVSDEIYEAARVDGAGPLKRFAAITIPMISPAILFSIVINLIGIFGGALLLDPGNPFTGGISIFDNYIGQVMFSGNELGYAAALAWVFFILMLIVTLTLFRTSNRWVYYPEADGEEDY